MTERDCGPWDLDLEVVGMQREPGCGWNYESGFKVRWDGRHYPKGMCPFAWNAFAPWIWTLRYGGSNAPLGYQDEDEMTFVCPDSRHMILWRISRVKEDEHAIKAPETQEKETVSTLRIEVDELPNGSGCERGYRVGDSWTYEDEIPEGFCPLAWSALSLWIWPLKYGGDPRPMGWSGPEVAYNCPIKEHPVVFRISLINEPAQVKCGS